MKIRKKTILKIRWRDFRNIQNRLYSYVDVLSNEIGPRNLQHYSALNKASDYITEQMTQQQNNFQEQQYVYNEKAIKNLIFEKPGQYKPGEIIIIGAHYDTVLDSPGADDNATAVACLLALIRMLHHYDNHRTIRFVAFTLEEPPFFGTEQMGSRFYARSCKEKDDNIVAMIALEMLGFYSEKRGSQKYPFPDMRGQYSDQGNFIAVVGNDQSHQFGIDFAESIKETSLIKTETIISGSTVHGIDLSDHSSFWKYDYPAIMITDTAFYRNPHYHEASDTIDKLNFKYFTRLVFALANALQKLDIEERI